MSVQRHIPAIDVQLTAQELAREFMEAANDYQADFLNECGRLMSEPHNGKNGWWIMQASYIDDARSAPPLTTAAREFVRILREYTEKD